MQAVILAAGKGLRLRPLTDSTPKALIDVCGQPLIFHILSSLPDDVTEIFIVVGYLYEQIKNAVGNAWKGKPVQYIIQDPLDGTGSALHLVKDRLIGKFLVVNGDDVYDKVDLERLIAHELGLLVLSTMEPVTASALQDADGRFIGIESTDNHPQPLLEKEGSQSREEKLRVCGAYILDERFFRYPLATVTVHDKSEYSLPHTIVEMTRDLSIKIERADNWQPVGTPEELEKIRKNCLQ